MKLPKDDLKLYGIDFTDEHWIPNRKAPKGLVRRLYSGLKGEQYRHKFYKLIKMCHEDRCVCPDCYKVIPSFGKNTFDVQEIKEIAEQIDLSDFYIIGAKKYLAKYNEDKIEFLQISKDQLYAAVFVLENGYGKEEIFSN